MRNMLNYRRNRYFLYKKIIKKFFTTGFLIFTCANFDLFVYNFFNGKRIRKS